ncbi:hypothetical protein CXB45_06360 [Corynebacterium mastitidis]|uniref:Uncharacterized protein n=1 Tax=Corynebacterium mastitidis TaxID=161890 RepID=A0A2N0X7E1_9CORY|nr:hypothetical protein CXB45_06360 [Corynebacterium mastitidis]
MTSRQFFFGSGAALVLVVVGAALVVVPGAGRLPAWLIRVAGAASRGASASSGVSPQALRARAAAQHRAAEESGRSLMVPKIRL